VIEYRAASEVELAGNTLSGLAVPYGELSRPMRDPNGSLFQERFLAGAFRDFLKSGEDVFLFYGHEHRARLPMARRGINLTIRDTERGLFFSADLPDTGEARDVRELLRSNILPGSMSFGFKPLEERAARVSELRVREVVRAMLPEISIVPRAQYAGTHAQLRSDAAEGSWAPRRWSLRRELLTHAYR